LNFLPLHRDNVLATIMHVRIVGKKKTLKTWPWRLQPTLSFIFVFKTLKAWPWRLLVTSLLRVFSRLSVRDSFALVCCDFTLVASYPGWVPAPEFRDAVGPPSLPLPLSLPAWWRASLGAASSWCSACAQRNPSCLFLVGVSGSARQRYLPAHRHLLLLLPLMPPPLDPLSLADGGWSVCSLRQPAHLLWFLCSRIPADGGRMSRGAAVGGLHRVPACSARLRFGYPTLILFFTHPRTEQGTNR